MIPLLDTHQHLLYRNMLNYHWTKDIPALAEGNFAVKDYQDLTHDKGIIGTIFMEVDADDYHFETRYIAELVAEPRYNILGIISSCRPETDDGFDKWLEECTRLPVCGYRRILHEVPDEMSTSETFRSNIRKIGAQSKVFDMVFRADQLPIAYDLAAACDDMVLMLDHCGVPDIAADDAGAWRSAISRLAELEHVQAKISGVLAYCAPGTASLDTIRPYVDHVIECFGPERLVWGSDWPVVNLGSDLPNWVDIFRQLISDLSPAEQEAISFRNAQRIYAVDAGIN